MFTSRCARSLTALALIFVARIGFGQRPAQWTVDPKAAVTIGASETDTTDLLTTVVGATRLPDGKILVGDNGPFALRVFSPGGKAIRSFGRKGAGPGEINYLAKLLRCGDSLVTIDIEGSRISVFSLDGKYVRFFRFGSLQTSTGVGGVTVPRQPYASACNSRMMFAHFGWENHSEITNGVFRSKVPFWLSSADSVVIVQLGYFPGVERFGIRRGGSAGSSPMPLGKQTQLVISSDRVYIGTGDAYEILAFDLTGKPRAAVRAQRPGIAVTEADIARYKAIQTAGMNNARRSAAEQRYTTMTFPTTLPAHGALLVDATGNLWVQDYPRPTSRSVAWSVFGPGGNLIATTAMPSDLEVYEIGADYVLGRYFDPEEAIPQVRLYTLRR